MKQGTIGVFDSGYGGLTILKEIVKRLPEYNYIYLGDNARAPYGNRSYEVVYEFTLQAVKALFDRGCELVILACNTASAKALRTIQQIDIPKIDPDKRVLGVIRPSTEAIGDLTLTGHVGVLATEGTVNSGSYAIELHKFSPQTTVVQHACPLWVPLIENNQFDTIPGRAFIKQDVEHLLSLDKEIDLIVLGCTHYPLIQSIIEEVVPKHIKVLAQGELVSEKLAWYLKKHQEIESKLAQEGQIQFLTTDDAQVFNKQATAFYGQPVESQQIHL